MRKTIRNYVIIWAVLVALFNSVVFVTPSEAGGLSKFGGAFWVGYVVIMLAFLSQLICTLTALKSETKDKLFLHLPLIKISYSTLVVSIIIGTLCMAIPNLPNWIGIVVCALIFAFNAIAAVKATTAADLVSDLQDKVARKTLFIKELTVRAEGLMTGAKSAETKTAAKKVYEAARYSDPMSDSALAGLENQISDKMEEFAAFVKADNAVGAEKAAQEVVAAINARNQRCKALK